MTGSQLSNVKYIKGAPVINLAVTDLSFCAIFISTDQSLTASSLASSGDNPLPLTIKSVQLQ